eukprot:jgi/Undpi1/4006/HiC_scaffold_16.g07374.m1
MAKPGRRTAADAGVGGGGETSDGSAQHRMKLRRRPALGDISSAVSNNVGAPSQDKGAVAAGARKTRKRKADGGFTVPSAKSRSAQAPPHPHPTGSSRGASSSSSSHARGGCASAATAASSSCAQQHQEEEVEESCRRGGGSLRERSNREASRKIGIGREALERLKRCNVPPSVVSEHDVDDRDDPVSCAEYVVDMYKRFKELEEKFTPTVYMHTQIDINCKMRAILIDWIVEVHLKFKLADPTLYLTCHIIDRFCMQENVHRSKLQLVGVTALLIACKYEEIFPTEVRDCVYITDHAYTREEVLEMEQTILRRLKFEITVPTPWTFLVRFLKVAKATDRQHHRAQYYLERCLQEHDGLSFRPSMLAAASVFLARIPDSGLDDAWPTSLASFCNIPREGLECCARMIIKFLLDEPVTASQRHLVAVKKKFLGERFLAVAIDDLPELPLKPHIPGN